MIESYIEDPRTPSPQVHRLLDQAGSGHLYASYPDGAGTFMALVVECKGSDNAIVHEIADGNALEIGFDPSTLPEGTTSTDVAVESPFEKEITSPDGTKAKLIVRALGATASN